MKPGRLRVSAALIAATTLFICLAIAASESTEPENVYATYGVHNDSQVEDCAFPNCIYKRRPMEPTDPRYPAYWTMYRVFNKYRDNPPPYDREPPAALKDGVDYQTSWGTTYYDSTWRGWLGNGATDEQYDKFCLPIFPIPNNYSCSFISLGDTAFFVTYNDRPSWMPPVCLFSPRNHSPERDFIKHLSYASGDSARLKNKVQGYSFWVRLDGSIMHVGAVPDETAGGGILFGYAFNKRPTPDGVDKRAAAYRHPQSFYFSGVPKLPGVPLPDAPIVSQNYTDFAIVRPDPAKTWGQVSNLDPSKLPACQLFNPPPSVTAGATNPGGSSAAIPTWGSIGRR